MEYLEQLFTFAQLIKLGQIILVDLVLAGDNAIVIGMVAAKYTAEHRRKVILLGVGAAVLLRIAFALITVQLLAIRGVLFIGGVLLLWICWKLWQDLRNPPQLDSTRPDDAPQNPPLATSVMQIGIADLSMSLDNVLAVAGIAAGDHLLLIIGLTLAVAFMVFAASLIANLLAKHRWIGYLGLAIILYVAVQMTYKGAMQVLGGGTAFTDTLSILFARIFG